MSDRKNKALFHVCTKTKQVAEYVTSMPDVHQGSNKMNRWGTSNPAGISKETAVCLCAGTRCLRNRDQTHKLLEGSSCRPQIMQSRLSRASREGNMMRGRSKVIDCLLFFGFSTQISFVWQLQTRMSSPQLQHDTKTTLYSDSWWTLKEW